MTASIYSKDHQRVVARLKKARAHAGLSQVEVAALLGKTQSHVSKIESGQRRIDIVQLNEFAKVYKKKLDFFMS